MKFKNLLLLITLLFLLINAYLYKNIIFSYPFVDEQYNFTIGKYLNKNEMLYEDIITNHQPITHILSGLVQKYKSPNTTYLLIQRHRMFIIVWSFVWALFLSVYFGWAGLLFVLIFELTKVSLFGNLFLAENFAVYPLVFLSGIVLLKKELKNWELILSGACLSFLALTLGPIWPVLGFISCIILYKQRSSLGKSLFLIVLGWLPIIFLVLKYTSFEGYIYYYLYTNLIYTVPAYHGSYHESWILTIIKAFLSPVISFLNTDLSPSLWVVKMLSLLTIVNLIFFTVRKKYLLALTIFFLLGLSNIRFVYPGNTQYAGFHLLPWYSILTFVSSYLLLSEFKQKPKYLKFTSCILILLALLFSFKYAGEIFAKKDINKEYEINYSTNTTLGGIVRIIKNPTDTLFVSNDTWLIYWQSDASHLPKIFGYYTWMKGIPSLRESVLKTLSSKPPTFIYCDNCKNSELEKFTDLYLPIERSGQNSHLYILPGKMEDLTDTQKNQLKFYGVDL